MREYFTLQGIPWEELRPLQEKELGCLLHLDAICRANNLRYFVGGGTCIGALREGGFLAWDDDIDIWMPRPDYERLHEIYDAVNTNPNYRLCRNTETECYHINCSFIKDITGTFINKHSVEEDVCHGIPIDVMALDAAPSNPFARLEQIFLSILESIYISQRLPDHQGSIVRALTHIPLALVRKRSTRYRIWKWCEKRMTRWKWEDCTRAVELTTGLKVKFHSLPKEWFDTTKPAMFEGHEIQVAQGAEQYMEFLFGDWRKPPAESEKTPRHNIAYANMDVPYSEYKGVYYCVKGQ